MPRAQLSEAVACQTCKAKPGEPCKPPVINGPSPSPSHPKRRERWIDAELARLHERRIPA